MTHGEINVTNWMTSNWDLIASRKLSQVCLPTSHDSGTFIHTLGTVFGTERVTKTQSYDFGNQIAQGVRSFDIRPAWVDTGIIQGWYTAHSSKLPVIGVQGAVGANLATAFTQMSTFFSDASNNKELLILNLSHFIDWNTGKMLSKAQMATLFDLIRKHIGHLLVKANDDQLNLAGETMESLLAKGNIIVLIDDDYPLDAGASKFGFWTNKNLPINGSYANTNNVNQMIQDQRAKMEEYQHSDQQDFLMSISWQLTLQGTQNVPGRSISILDLAAQANIKMLPTLTGWLADKTINTQIYPNLLQTDNCGIGFLQSDQPDEGYSVVDFCLKLMKTLNF
ncbi:MAG: hypothetical protein ACPGJS_02675 [Flammeovirgaceae bacterium]